MNPPSLNSLAIIGAGKVGSTLGRVLAERRKVVFGVKNPSDSKHAALLTAVPGAKVASSSEAVAQAEIVILATPWTAVAEAVEACDGFAGKILIDATNPLGMTAHGLSLTTGFSTSGAEQIQAMAPKGFVFKTFNQTGYEVMSAAHFFAQAPVMFVAGDNAASRPAVMALVADAGFEAVDAGPLASARLLEPLAVLWIDLALKRGQGRDFAFALTRKEPRP